MKILKRWVIPLQIVFLLLQPFTLSSNITCSAGIATLGSPTKITCNFNRNIGSPKLNFVIWRFPLDTQDLDDSTYRKDVLSCNWLDVGGLNCRTTGGYEFNQEQTVITTANVDIPSATADQEGIYKCLLVTQEIIPTSPCNLTVQEREGNQATQDIKDFISGDLTELGAFILLVVTIGLLIISAIVNLFFCYKYVCRWTVDVSMQTANNSAERTTSTTTLNAKGAMVNIGVGTEVLTDRTVVPTLKEKSTGLFSRKGEKKIPTKPSTLKNSQDDLSKKEEEKQLLLQSSQPVSQYVPLIPVKDPKAEHAPGGVELTQEAVGGADVAEAGHTATMETSVDIGDPAETAQDTTKTDDDTALYDNGEGTDGKKRKKGIKAVISSVLHKTK